MFKVTEIKGAIFFLNKSGVHIRTARADKLCLNSLLKDLEVAYFPCKFKKLKWTSVF